MYLYKGNDTITKEAQKGGIQIMQAGKIANTSAA